MEGILRLKFLIKRVILLLANFLACASFLKENLPHTKLIKAICDTFAFVSIKE